MIKGYKNTSLGRIPDDWEIIRIGDISELITKGTTPTTIGYDFVDEGINYIKSENIGSNGYLIGEYLKITDECNEKLKRSIILENDILVSIVGYVGKSAIVSSKDVPANTNQNIAIVRVKQGKHSQEYIKRLFESTYLENYVNRNQTIGAQPSLSLKQISDFEGPVPPLPEQKKIAKILSTVDGHIDEVDGMIEDMKELKKGLMQKLLTEGIGHTKFKDSEVGRIPKEWEVKTFESICIDKGLVRGPFGGALKKEFFVEDGYKVYEQKNAISKSADIGDYYIDQDKYKELERFAVDEGDFIVSCSGTIGRIFQIPPNHKPGVINQALLKITLNINMIDENFFYQYFEYEKFQNRIIDSTQGGAMKNLVGMPIIKKTMFPVPPIDEQQKIAAILDNVDERIVIVNEEKDELNELKKGLMQQLLTGKVRVMV